MRVLGIDPGACGAAVLLDGGALRWWAVWSLLAAGYRLRHAGYRGPRLESGTSTEPSLLDVGGVIGRIGPIDVLAIEGLGSRSWGAQPLIEGVGELRAGARLGGLRWGREIRPLAVARRRGEVGWRAAVLGLGPRIGADLAEMRAIAWATPRGLPLGLTRAEQGAWSEARAIATYGEGA